MQPPPSSLSLQKNVYPGPRTFTNFAAMPPPASPFDPRDSQLPDPQKSSFQGPERPSPQSTRPTALVDEERPGFAKETPELPSEEDFAKSSARFNEAMAEIDWLSDPFLGSGVDLSDILPIDPSPAPVEDFELDFMYPAQGEDTVLDPSQAQQLQNEAGHSPPDLLLHQGLKRKEHDEGDENFQPVQLDERQVRHPVKRMRVSHGSKPPSNQATSKPSVASSSRQQWQRLAPWDEEYPSPYSQEQSFGGPIVCRAQPLSRASVEQAFLPTDGNPYQERNETIVGEPRASYYVGQPSIGSPFIPTVAAGVQTPEIDLWKFLEIDPADTRSHGDLQTGEMLEDPSAMVPPGYASQPPISQQTAPPPRSRTDRGEFTGAGFDDSLQDGQMMRRTPGMFSSAPAMQPSVSQPVAMRSRAREDRGGLTDMSFHNNLHAGDILNPASAIFPLEPTSQPPMSQTPITRPTSRADRGHARGDQENCERRYGHNPYAEL